MLGAPVRDAVASGCCHLCVAGVPPQQTERGQPRSQVLGGPGADLSPHDASRGLHHGRSMLTRRPVGLAAAAQPPQQHPQPPRYRRRSPSSRCRYCPPDGDTHSWPPRRWRPTSRPPPPRPSAVGHWTTGSAHPRGASAHSGDHRGQTGHLGHLAVVVELRVLARLLRKYTLRRPIYAQWRRVLRTLISGMGS